MSKQEKQMAGAMRIFEALSGVDEELLIRCEDEAVLKGAVFGAHDGKGRRSSKFTGKKAPIWYYGKVLAACLCFVVMGALLWSVRPIMETASKSSGSVDMAPAAAAEAPEAAMEEAACENATALEGAVGQSDTLAERDNGSDAYGTGEAGTVDSGLLDGTTESRVEDLESVKQESAKQESAQQESANQESANQEAASGGQNPETEQMNGSKNSEIEEVMSGVPLDKRKELTLKEAAAVAVLGEYVPTAVPAGYIFESAYLTENATTGKAERISLCWLKGMDDIRINISYASEDVTTVDVSKTETYDVHQYEIPYASTVPQEYRTVFNNPVFAVEDFTRDIVKMRMKVVADTGDTATPRGKFGVLYDDGVLVEFSGDGDAESIYAMMVSIK